MRANFISMRGVAIGTVPIFKNVATKIHKIKTEKNSENTFHVKTRHFLVNSNLTKRSYHTIYF